MRRLSLFLLLLAPLICPGADIHGTYVAKRPGPEGGEMETIFVLNQSGSELTGKVILPFGESAIKNGKVEGSRVTFMVEFGDPASPFKIPYEGTIAGEDLHLKVTPPGRPAMEMIAKPSADVKIAEPPAKLPLPALRDLPSNSLAMKPPMGWNSWNKFANKVDDHAVREIADAIAENGMKDAGYLYVNIDDTWQGKRDADGNIQPNQKFPDMKALASYVHSKGLLIGIYSSPGPKTCGGHEGSYGHEEQDARQFASWGIDFLKYDWCSAGRIYQPADMQAAYQKMGEALLKTGRPIFYSLCQYGMADVQKWGPKVAGNSWRTTGDIADNWKSMSDIGFAQSDLAPFAGPGHWNDPDMLEVGNGGMTDTEYRTHMTLWAILAAPLLAGNDVRSMSAATKEILLNKEVLAVNQDRLGTQGKRLSKNGDQETWTKPMSDGSIAVALFNRAAAPRTINVTWKELGKSSNVAVRDAWKHENLTTAGDGWSGEVAAHGVVLLRVSGSTAP